MMTLQQGPQFSRLKPVDGGLFRRVPSWVKKFRTLNLTFTIQWMRDVPQKECKVEGSLL